MQSKNPRVMKYFLNALPAYARNNFTNKDARTLDKLI